VLREHVGPLVFALTALTSLLLLNYIAKQIDELVGKGLSAGVIGQFFALSIPFTVAMTTPMSVLVATLYAFSRLASENEVTAMKANGISLSRLLVPVLLSASVISIGMIAFNDIVLPAANHQLRKLQSDIARKKPTFALKEQIINQVADRQVYLKAMKLGNDNRMTDVTIYDLTDVMRRRTIYADSGELAFAANGEDLLLTLYDGTTFEVPRAKPEELQRARFDRNYVRVEGVANQLEMSRSDSYKSDREMSVCELQNEVARYEAELIKSRNDLREAMRVVAVEALTGVPANPPDISSLTFLNVTPGATAPRSPNASIGRAFCDFKLRLQRAKAGTSVALLPSLYAATPPQGTPPPRARPRTPAQDSAAKRLLELRKGPASPPPVIQPPRQAPAITVNEDSIDAVRDSLAAAFADSVARARADSLLAGVAPSRGFAAQLPVVLTGSIDNARIRLRDNQRIVNTNAVELHKKFAISIACTVFVLVGAPIALRFPRGGVGLVIGVSLVIFGIYYIGLIAGESLADKNLLTPFWAMWAANILLTIVGVFLLARMGRESSTARGGDFREMLEIFRNVFRRDRRPRPVPPEGR
jgi:lipopolysaccharide export system permease protein